MPLTIPNSADAAFGAQSEPDSRDFDAIVAAMGGTCVLAGCAVTAQGVPNMTVAVASGTIASSTTVASVTGGNVTIAANASGNPRFDLVVATAAGALAARQGTAAVNPTFPTLTAGDVMLAAVWVPNGAAAINANQIIDKRAINDYPTANPVALAAAANSGSALTISLSDHVHPTTGLGVLASANTWTNLNTITAPAGSGVALTITETITAQVGTLEMVNLQTTVTPAGAVSGAMDVMGFQVSIATASSNVSGSTTRLFGAWSGAQSSVSIGALIGHRSEANNTGAGTTALMGALEGLIRSTGGGVVTQGNVIWAEAPITSGGGTFALAVGLRVEPMGSASITNAFGIDVAAVTGSTLNVGARLSGGTQANLWLNSNTAGAGGGITFGTAGPAGDTFLYRTGAGQLRIDSQLGVGITPTVLFHVSGAMSTDYAARIINTSATRPSGLLLQTTNASGTLTDSVLNVSSAANQLLKIDHAGLFTLNASVQIDAQGRTSIGGTTGSTVSFLVLNGTHPWGSTGTVYGVASQFTTPSTATASTGFYTGLITPAVAFTLTTGIGLQVAAPTKGAGSTITNMHGILIADQFTTSSNSYGLTMSAQGGVGMRLDGANATANLWLRSDTASALGGMAFGVSADTALYRTAAGQLRIDSQLGIGMTPARVLDVTGAVTLAYAAIINNSATGANRPSGLLVSTTNASTTTTDAVFAVVSGANTVLKSDHAGLLTVFNDIKLGVANDNRYIYLNQINTGTGELHIQAGAGSAGYGGGINMYGHTHATFPGWVKAGISVSSGGKFSVNTWGTGGGTDVFTVDAAGVVQHVGSTQVDAAGRVGVWATPSGTAGVEVAGAHPSTGPSTYGVNIHPTFSSSTTTEINGFRVQMTTPAVVYTVVTAVALRVVSTSLGAGSVITNNYGIWVEPRTVGTNDYGVRIDSAQTQTLWISGDVSGTTLAQGIAFGASRDTGIYRIGANALGVVGSIYSQPSSGNANIVIDAAAAGSSVIDFQEAGVDKWWIYRNSGDNHLYVRDTVNAKMVASFLAGGAGVSQFAVTDLFSTAGGLFQVDAAGRVGLGGAGTTAAELLQVGGGVSHPGVGGVTLYGVVSNPNFPVGTTSNAYAYYGQLRTAASTITSQMFGYYLEVPNLGASSAITALYGMYVANQGNALVTTSYGLLVAAQSGSGATVTARFDAGTTNTLWVTANVNPTTESGGIVFGSSKDTNLYRLTTSRLRTDDNFDVGTALFVGTSPAAGGTINIPNNAALASRNAANSADINLIFADSSDIIKIGSTNFQINTSGQLGVGSALSTAKMLNIFPTHPGNATTLYGLFVDVTYPVTTTVGAYTAYIRSRTAASTPLTWNLDVYVVAPVYGAGSAITNSVGAYIENRGSALVTNAYGVWVLAQTGGVTRNVAGRFDTSTDAAIWVGGDANGTTQTGGIIFRSDRSVNLYADGANSLKTDDALTVGGAFLVSGTMGIGPTAGPNALTITQTGLNTGITATHINMVAAAGGYGGGFSVRSTETGTSTQIVEGSIEIEGETNWSSVALASSYMRFSVAVAGTLTERMRLSPSAGLTVTGALTATTTIAANTGLTVGTNAGTSVVLGVNAAAAQQKDINFQTAGVRRWLFRSDATAESGSNVGSDFEFYSFDDAGTTLWAVWSVKRSTGVTTYGKPVTFTADSIVGNDPVQWTHSNTLYRGSLGVYSGAGHPFVGLHAEHSTTANTLMNDGSGSRGAVIAADQVSTDAVSIQMGDTTVANALWTTPVTLATFFYNAGIPLLQVNPGLAVGVSIAGAATGSPARVVAIGTDTNIIMAVNAKGTGSTDLNVASSTGTGGTRFGDGAGTAKALIDSTGRLSVVASGAATNVALFMQANHPGNSTTMYSFINDLVAPATTTVAFVGNLFRIRTAAGFTLPIGYNVWLETPVVGTAITTNYGIYMENQGGTGVGTSFGLRVLNQNSAGTASYAASLEGGQTANLWLASDTASAAGGIAFGTTIAANQSMYRQASGVIEAGGTFSAVTGYQVNHATATAGHYLRGDGTRFIDGVIAAGDLPSSGIANVAYRNTANTFSAADQYWTFTPSAGSGHLNFGVTSAVSGSPSSKLTFQGAGVDHGGIYWTPNSTTGNGTMIISHGGSGDPAAQTTMATHYGDGRLTIPNAFTATVANGSAIIARSGASGSWTRLDIGRTAIEMDVAVTIGGSTFFTGDAAGDGIVRVASSSNALRLGVGAATAQLVIANTVVTATSAANRAISVRSGASGSWAGLEIGRTGVEFDSAVSAAGSTFFTGDAAGDAALRMVSTSNKLHIGVGTAYAQIQISNTYTLLPTQQVLGTNAGTMHYYPHVVTYDSQASVTGAIIISTPITWNASQMTTLYVRGYIYDRQVNINFMVSFYPYSGGSSSANPINITFTDLGNDGLVKRIGVDAGGKIAVSIGDIGTLNYFAHVVVDAEITQGSTLWPTGWSVSTTTTSGFGWTATNMLTSNTTTTGNLTINQIGTGGTQTNGYLHFAGTTLNGTYLRYADSTQLFTLENNSSTIIAMWNMSTASVILAGTATIQGAATTMTSPASNNPYYMISDGTSIMKMQMIGTTYGWTGTQSNHPYVLGTNNVENVRILTSGKMQGGYGFTNNPAYVAGTLQEHFLGYANNSPNNWAMSIAYLGDSSWVSHFITLNSRLTGGTQSAPTFTSGTGSNGGTVMVHNPATGIFTLGTVNGVAVAMKNSITLEYVNGFVGLGVAASSSYAVYVSTVVNTAKGLVIRAVTSQSAVLQEWQGPAGSPVYGEIDSAGVHRQYGASAGIAEFAARVTGDTVDRLVITADGSHSWGPGNAATDTTLARVAVGVLQLSGEFNIIGQSVTTTLLVLRPSGSLTADYQQFQDSSANVLSRVDGDGYALFKNFDEKMEWAFYAPVTGAATFKLSNDNNTTLTTTGTLTSGALNNMPTILCTSGAVSGNTSGVISNAVWVTGNYEPEFHARVLLDSTITNIRIWIGLVANDMSGVGVVTTQTCLAFRYDTGVPDTKWQCISSDGTSGSGTDSGVTPVASTLYTFAIVRNTQAANEWRFYINGNLVATKSVNMPATSTGLRPQICVTTLTAAARAIHVGFCKVRIN